MEQFLGLGRLLDLGLELPFEFLLYLQFPFTELDDDVLLLLQHLNQLSVGDFRIPQGIGDFVVDLVENDQ